MPSYELYNTKTKKRFEKWMSISEYVQYLKEHPHVQRVFQTAPAFTMDGKSFKDVPSKLGGFKEVLQKIGEKHPTSPLNERVRARPRTAKEVATDAVVGKALKKKNAAIAEKKRRDTW